MEAFGSYFSSPLECRGGNVQRIGGDARLCLLQLFNAGYMPPTAFCAAAVAVALAAVANAARLSNSLKDRSWALWKEMLGLLGVVLLTQVPPPPPPFPFASIRANTHRIPLLALMAYAPLVPPFLRRKVWIPIGLRMPGLGSQTHTSSSTTWPVSRVLHRRTPEFQRNTGNCSAYVGKIRLEGT